MEHSAQKQAITHTGAQINVGDDEWVDEDGVTDLFARADGSINQSVGMDGWMKSAERLMLTKK